MKIRQGFVSNSSTSSFVIYGFKKDLDDEEIKQILKAYDMEADEDDFEDKFDDLCNDIDLERHDEGELLGFPISSMSFSDSGVDEVDFEEMKKDVKEVNDKIDEFFTKTGIKKRKCKIFGGIECS